MLWSSDQLKKLNDIFDDDITLTFQAQDEPDKNFELVGIKNVYNFYSDVWEKNVDRSNTKIEFFNARFNAEPGSNLFVGFDCWVTYKIIQKHFDADNCFEAQELFQLENNKIKKISLYRFSKTVLC